MVFGGEALGRLDGQVVFVPFAAPGDQLSVQVVQRKARFLRAQIAAVERAGPDRVVPICEHFATCGGCQWQQLSPVAQQREKRRIVAETLSVSLEQVSFFPSAASEGYRQRCRLAWSRDALGLRLGYRQWRSNAIVDIDDCPVLEKALRRALPQVRRALQLLPSANAGTIQLLVGTGGDVHASLRLEQALDATHLAPILDALVDQPIVGAVCPELRLLRGQQTIEQAEIGQPSLRGSASCFAQAQRAQNTTLVDYVVEQLACESCDVLELYAGTGNFSRYLQQRCRRLTAVELSPQALSVLPENAPRARTVGQAAELFVGQQGVLASVDRLLLNPPRQGAREVVDVLAKTPVERIVYVSCDPPTLARDLQRLFARGYMLASLAAFDMMPHSFHVETVATLVREE
ncbi:MAG: class I SAM-dependent RNA methyltransferase [Deltaproteobacteria bacterium]|nr:class I SAM-dependent RNA methyltransferase [Deltaproteobacteria bacterium]